MQSLSVQQIHLVWAYLENHNLAIISLQVERPGGGDEALSRADDFVAPTGHGLHHGGGLRAESHGLQLEGGQHCLYVYTCISIQMLLAFFNRIYCLCVLLLLPSTAERLTFLLLISGSEGWLAQPVLQASCSRSLMYASWQAGQMEEDK